MSPMVRLTILASQSRAQLITILLLLLSPMGRTASATDQAPAAPPADARKLTQLGPGDSVSLQVYGQPEMNGTINVADDGTLNVPLAGQVQVSGLSPAEASALVEKVLKQGQFLVAPHVTISVVQSRSQRVVVLGEVRNPGRYMVESNSSIFDLLAQAGGVTEKGANVVYILRPDGQGNVNRTPLDLKALAQAKDSLGSLALQGGDSVLVPVAEQYFIYGEVVTPNMYRLEPGMTVIQAIARAGGVTLRGSDRRIEIKRPGKDGKYVIIRAKPDDLVRANDVIRVKESIF
jgi:polysaccharide export outer membrane protein